MKPIKNFFKLFLEMFAWIFVIAVISLSESLKSLSWLVISGRNA